MNSLIIFAAKYLLYIVALLGAVFWFTVSRAHKIYLVASGVLGGIIAIILTKLSGALYYDPRPFVVNHTQPLIHHAADNGFPSDHTVLATLAALTVFQINRRVGLAMLALAIALGVSRIAAGVHSPLDIATGLIIGAVSVAMAAPLAKRVLRGKFELV